MSDFIHPPEGNAPVAIYEDGGGLVSKYQAAAFEYNLTGRKVKILGSCRSACIYALSVKNVCVGPNAVVKAHMAYEKYTNILREDITDQMISALPQPIYERLNGNITKNYNPKTTLTYNDLISLGIPKCRNQVYAKDTPYHVLKVKPITGENANAR
jgi:hypothetical protein